MKLKSVSCRSPKIHETPLHVDIESSRSPAKSESWYNPSLHCCAVFFRMTILSVITRVMNVRNQTSQACHMLSSMLWLLVPVGLPTTDKMSGVPMRAGYRHVRTIWEETFDKTVLPPFPILTFFWTDNWKGFALMTPFHQLLGHCFFWCWSWFFGFHCVVDFPALDHRAFLSDSDLSLLDGCPLTKVILLSPHPVDILRGM